MGCRVEDGILFPGCDMPGTGGGQWVEFSQISAQRK
jgi:hypothetical protein